MLGIAIAPKKRKAATHGNVMVTQEERRQKKNEVTRKSNQAKSIAFKIIAEYFGMGRATHLETLEALVEAGERCEKCT